MTVNLEEFIKYLIKKWKMVCVITVLVTVCFAAGAMFLGEEITVPHSEEYLHYEQELEWHESYLEESILMNLDPLSIYERTLLLRNISDYEVLKNYAVSSEIWEEYETARSKKYISELVQWIETEDSNTIELQLRHATEEECLSAAEYLQKKLQAKDLSVEIIIGAEKIVVDEKLQEEHLRWYDRIYYVNSLLLDSQAGYTISVNKPIAVITGVLTGKGLNYGGSLARTQATGYGLCYFAKEMLATRNESFEGKTVRALVEETKPNGYSARMANTLVVHFKSENKDLMDNFVNLKITGKKGTVLTAELLNK